MKEELYEGREQTEVKHRILERYLSAFAPIVGDWAAEVAYIDCFAGPWGSRGSNLQDTSFAKAINVLRASKASLEKRGKQPTFRCLLIESVPERFERLNAFAQGVSDLEVIAKNWHFQDHIGDIIAFAKSRRNSFPFFFIDPTGWEFISIELIKPILALEPGEVLVNLMTSWIKRFLSDERKNFERLLGPHVGRLRELSGDEQEEELVRCYAEALRRAGRFRYVCTLPVLKADADMFHFWMIYGTRHPKGVEVFKNAERVVIPFMHETRAESQERRKFLQSGGQLPLLDPQATYYERRLTRLQQKNLQVAKLDLIEFLAQGQRARRFDELWARAMQFSLVGERDLKEWLSQWTQAGQIQLVNLKPNERVPKRGAGHLVRWNPETDVR